ncbi:hypothetical protein AVEN_153423-1 [Araneus ventricosus]|uniref:Uncharacterized protein n=1 Tax=Araneus ventricosus TaxID=182803 RepID=A0A4Y2E8L2_ARAVE|nr:hypothetical protein AVEN_153423-1 [Araneus ventricosus]
MIGVGGICWGESLREVSLWRRRGSSDLFVGSKGLSSARGNDEAGRVPKVREEELMKKNLKKKVKSLSLTPLKCSGECRSGQVVRCRSNRTPGSKPDYSEDPPVCGSAHIKSDDLIKTSSMCVVRILGEAIVRSGVI